MITLGKLRAKQRVRLRVLHAQALGPPTLAPCYREQRCTSCEACDVRAPLSGVLFAVLRSKARDSVTVDETPARRKRRRAIELNFTEELVESQARGWIRRRDWQIMRGMELAAQWEAEERAAADRQLVADVAERRRREAAA